MKKLVCMLLAVGLLASLASCGGTEDKKGENSTELSSAASEVSAESKEEESSATEVNLADLFEWQNVDGGIEITKYKGSDTVVVTPDIIENKKVVSLGNTFEGNVVIESLTISKYVTKVDLTECDALKKVYWNAEALPKDNHRCVVILPESLEELYMPCVKNFYFAAVEENAPNLKVLDISSCTAIPTHKSGSLTSVKLAAGGATHAFYMVGSLYGLSTEGKYVTNGSDAVSTDSKWVELTDENRAALYAEVLGSNCTVSFAE